MNTDYFQSHTVSLILSWIFSIPMTIGLIVGLIFLLFTKEEDLSRPFLIWIAICVILCSPFRYMVFQIILAESYGVQSAYAFFTLLALTAYIPIVFGVLYGIGLGLPILGIAAIAGFFRNTTSKTRLLLASIAAPFLLFIGSFLFFLILPYAAYSVHWLRAEDVIRATNGPAEYYYKYVAHWETQRSLQQYGQDTGLGNLTSKEQLRIHVATTYLGRKQLAYYVYEAYPEYAKQQEKGSRLDNLVGTPQEWPELTNEEKLKLNSVTTKMVMGKPLSEEDLEGIRRLQRNYIKRTGIIRTEEEKEEEARIATKSFKIIYQYNAELYKCLLQSFDTKVPYLSDDLKKLRKTMEALDYTIKSKLDADFHKIYSTARSEVWTDESGQKHYPLSREEILKGFEYIKILKDNLQKYMEAVTNYYEQPKTKSLTSEGLQEENKPLLVEKKVIEQDKLSTPQRKTGLKKSDGYAEEIDKTISSILKKLDNIESKEKETE